MSFQQKSQALRLLIKYIININNKIQQSQEDENEIYNQP